MEDVFWGIGRDAVRKRKDYKLSLQKIDKGKL